MTPIPCPGLPGPASTDYWAHAAVGSLGMEIADQLVASQNLPIAVFNAGVSGSDIAVHLPANCSMLASGCDKVYETLYARLQRGGFTSTSQLSGKLRGIVFWGGDLDGYELKPNGSVDRYTFDPFNCDYEARATTTEFEDAFNDVSYPTGGWISGIMMTTYRTSSSSRARPIRTTSLRTWQGMPRPTSSQLGNTQRHGRALLQLGSASRARPRLGTVCTSRSIAWPWSTEVLLVTWRQVCALRAKCRNTSSFRTLAPWIHHDSSALTWADV